MSKCNDSWNGKDKALLFGVCFVLAAICPLVAIVLAIIKEAYDHHTTGNHWCWKDILADAVVVVLGSVVYGRILLLIL